MNTMLLFAYTLNGNFGSDVKVILNVTLFTVAALDIRYVCKFK